MEHVLFVPRLRPTFISFSSCRIGLMCSLPVSTLDQVARPMHFRFLALEVACLSGRRLSLTNRFADRGAAVYSLSRVRCPGVNWKTGADI